MRNQKITHVELFDDKERTLGAFTIEDAAKRMNLNVYQLRGFMQLDGYCLADDPEVITARLLS